MKTLAELRVEVKELRDAYFAASAAYDAAERELRDRQRAAVIAKQSKCKHTTLEKRWDRSFEGEGFVDTEYNKCKKCGAVFDVRDVNIVLKSEK